MDQKKILIIDDDPRNIFALSLVLRSKGYHVDTVAGGKEGLEWLSRHSATDVVLLDMMMPEMDGYQVLHELRKQTDFTELPVIAVTAQAMPGDMEKCIEAGASNYISKPIDVDQLEILLAYYLKK